MDFWRADQEMIKKAGEKKYGKRVVRVMITSGRYAVVILSNGTYENVYSHDMEAI